MCKTLHEFAATLLSTGLLAGQAARLADAWLPRRQRLITPTSLNRAMRELVGFGPPSIHPGAVRN